MAGNAKKTAKGRKGAAIDGRAGAAVKTAKSAVTIRRGNEVTVGATVKTAKFGTVVRRGNDLTVGAAVKTAKSEANVARSKVSSVPPIVEEVLGTGTFSVEKFVECFDVLVEAAGGTKRLRNLLVQLAVRGVLCPVDRESTSALKLVERANSDRERKLDSGDARLCEPLPFLDLKNAPFAIPNTWQWLQVGGAMNLVNGRAFKPNDWTSSGLPIIRIQNLNDPTAPFNFCSFDVLPKFHVKPGALLIGWSGTPGTSFGASIWCGPAGILNQHIFRAEVYGNVYDLGFLCLAINARLDEMIAQAHGAVGLQHITKGRLEAVLIPLPPLAEQKRIVARVDQLMALIGELEAKQTRKRELGARFTQASLEALTTAECPEEFDAAWKRVVENWETVIDRAEKVSFVRGAIQTLAVRGILLSDNEAPNDDFLLSIERQRRELSEKSGYRLPDAAPVSLAAPPFSAPNGWNWMRLADVCYQITDGTHQTPQYLAGGVPFLSVKDVTRGFLDFSRSKYISQIEHEELSRRCCPQRGDVLFTKVGTTGIAQVVDTDQVFSIFVSLALLKVPVKLILPEYLALVLNSPFVRKQSADNTQGIGNKNLVLRSLRDFLVVIPPTKVQKRVVDKVEHLMKFCNELETALQRSENRTSKLVEAVVQEMVA